MNVEGESKLGVINKNPQQDVFGFHFLPDKKSFLIGWQSTPSALTRALPIILILIPAFLILAYLERSLIIPAFVMLALIGILTFYIVIFTPNRVVLADTSSRQIGDKVSGEVIEGEIDYQPEIKSLAKSKEKRK